MDQNQLGHVLFVCSGNTCRSPMAAALFRHALAAENEPLNRLEVKSAGIAAMEGSGASPNSIEAARKVGLRLDSHKSKNLTPELVDGALAIFCMTDSHRDIVSHRFQPTPKNLHLMRGFLGEANNADIPDPFGSNFAAYEAARDSMVEAIPSLVAYVRELVSKNPT